MIRKAVIEDARQVIEMARKFFNETAYKDLTEYDPRAIAKIFEKSFFDENYVVLVAEEESLIGMAVGFTHPLLLNASHLSGSELAWWVEKSTRGQKAGLNLFNALNKWAFEERKADSFLMIALESVNPEKTGEFYRRKGYKPMEHLYIRSKE